MQKTERTFGIEIEFGLDRNISDEAFKSEFEMRTGEEVSIQTRTYNTGHSNTKWILGYDSSVRVRNRKGYELKSPPIKLSQVNRIKKVY